MQRGEMRAGDTDRQAVAERLRVAVDEGRLDLYEYDERLRRAYAAKTYADLDGLLGDLPDPVAPERAQLAPAGGPVPADPLVPGPDGRYPGATQRWLAENWGPYLSVVGTVSAIWAIISIMSQELQYFWPMWVAGPWGAVLLVGTVGGLVRGEPQRWARKKAAKQARKQRSELTDQTRSEQLVDRVEPGRPAEREHWQLGGKAD